MPQVTANGVSIEYETLGRADNPPVLLIMGLGTQMIGWPDPFCRMLVDAGFYVIRFDNRDVGLSQKFDSAPTPGSLAVLLRTLIGYRSRRVAYTLEDMADDAVGLLDALGIDRAHIVGASMGGMIAQLVAARFPQRTLSLVSLMSSSGDRQMQKARWRDLWPLIRLKVPGRNAPPAQHIEYLVKVLTIIGSRGDLADPAQVRDVATRSVARSIDRPGTARQTAAIAANGSRRSLLRSIGSPTLVLHGKEDILLPPPAGFDTAMHIDNARLVMIDGMGHDLPGPLHGRLADEMVGHFQSVEYGEQQRCAV